MQSTIQKWGNSLAIRIPKPLAEEARVNQGSEVEIVVEEGEIRIKPKNARPYTLDELLEYVTEKNLHAEMPTGHAVGAEAW